MTGEKKLRVLLAKLGLDGHDRGVLLVAMALRDAGMEVIYLGRHRTCEQIAQAAIQEDVDLVGLSSMTDAHLTLAPRVVGILKREGARDIPIIVGGFIQPEDVDLLKNAGVDGVFGIGTPLEEIVTSIRDMARNV